VESWWPRFGARVVEKLASSGGWYARQQRIPALLGGKGSVLGGDALRRAEVLPPTEAGWRRFLEFAPASGLKGTELAEAADYWGARKLPRDVLTAAREEPAA